MSKINVTIEGKLAEFITGLAEKCSCEPVTIVENILLYRLAERTAHQEVYPNIDSYMPELLMQDGVLILTGEKLFGVMKDTKTAEFEEIKKMREIIDGLSETFFRTMPGGSA